MGLSCMYTFWAG